MVSSSQASIVEPGVSKTLARERKAHVSDVVYDISIEIDSVLSQNPRGSIIISFNYKPANQPLQLDFAGEDISDITVNDHKATSTVWKDGHIIIPQSSLKKGHNSIRMDFIAANRALNRNPGYMYTLFVPNRAHSVFPCFDQPDMKASYKLTLSVPGKWMAVSNSPVMTSVVDEATDTRTIKFGPTEPLSTYLFAFAAGDFKYRQYKDGERTIGAYYRETDPDRIAQLDDIFTQVMNSLRILEDYTGIPYAFAKYDLVILPGFQFGGMEHTGATFYNDNTIFLGKKATGADHLSRAKLIAHETAHMWFGDYVTMEWFDDVWTKEVFANYFAAMLTRELLPEFDHDLEWLRVYMAAALAQDRSEGSTPIRQELDNLKNAGLIYNNIIYNKSPLMMRKLAEIMGEENFKQGIRKYLNEHAYGNATWDDLIAAMSACSEADIEGFSRAWVYEKAMPRIKFTLRDGFLEVVQSDPLNRGVIWPQTFDVVVGDSIQSEKITVKFDGTTSTQIIPLSISSDSMLILPAADGRAYGLLVTETENLLRIMIETLTPGGLVSQLPPVGQLATLMMLNENYLVGNISTADWLNFLISLTETTTDGQMLSSLTSYIASALLDLPVEEAAKYEQRVMSIAENHPLAQGKTLALRRLIGVARAPQTTETLYDLWSKGESPSLSNDDFSTLALQLAVSLPEKSDSIIAIQRSRITDGDRLRKFDFISRAAVSDTLALDSLFRTLAIPENRLVEPWTLNLLSLLNHPLRHDRSINYIIPALEMLPEIQATGDIFFPANWSSSLLGSYRSEEAAQRVTQFLNNNQHMNPLLLNKVRQGASRLMLKQRRE